MSKPYKSYVTGPPLNSARTTDNGSTIFGDVVSNYPGGFAHDRFRFHHTEVTTNDNTPMDVVMYTMTEPGNSVVGHIHGSAYDPVTEEWAIFNNAGFYGALRTASSGIVGTAVPSILFASLNGGGAAAAWTAQADHVGDNIVIRIVGSPASTVNWKLCVRFSTTSNTE